MGSCDILSAVSFPEGSIRDVSSPGAEHWWGEGKNILPVIKTKLLCEKTKGDTDEF